MLVIARNDLVGLVAPPLVVGAGCTGEAAGATVEERLDLFFADPRSAAGRQNVARAVAICEACDGRLACAEFALITRQEYGTWGAITEQERRLLFREERRSRRRTGAAA